MFVMSVVKVKLCLCMPQRPIGERHIDFHPFLTLALDGDEWSTLHTIRFTHGERTLASNALGGGWVGPRVSLNVFEIKILFPLLRIEPRIVHSIASTLH
jgi:hypothetical protein